MDVKAKTPDLDWEEWKGDVPFVRHAVAGSFAGVAEHLAMFPFDTLKTRLQIVGTSGAGKIIWQIYRESGIRGFFKGATAIGMGCIPAHAALFSVYELLKSKLPKDKNFSNFVCGAAATVSHDCILTPMDVIKQRMQLGGYRTMTECIRRTRAVEGLGAFYRSLPATILMNVPYGATMVGVNEKLKMTLNENSGLGMYFLCAGISGGIASVVTNPLDVVKTRLQTQFGTLVGHAPKYKSIFSTIKIILLEEGPRGFAKGAGARVAVMAPSTAICWGTYETIKSTLNAMGRRKGLQK